MGKWSERWLADKQSRFFLTRFWYPLAMVVLFAGIAASWYAFPGPFDWRYRVVSSLISRVDNPEGNFYFCAALALTFALLLPLPRYFRLRLEPVTPRLAQFSFHALRLGFFAGALVGFERLYFRNLSEIVYKAHEYIALVAFFGLFLGVVGFWLAFARTWREKHGASLPVSTALFLVSAGPMIGAALSQAYLYFVPNQLGWVGPHWAQLGIPLYLSFAFWEWLASLGIFVYLYALLWLLPAEVVTKSTIAPTAPRKSS